MSKAIFNFMILQMHLKYSLFSEGSEQPSVYLNSLVELITLLKSEWTFRHIHCISWNATVLYRGGEECHEPTQQPKALAGKSGWFSVNKAPEWLQDRVSKLWLQQMFPQCYCTMSHLGLFWFHISKKMLHSCWIRWIGRAAVSCAQRSGVTMQRPL